MIEIIRHCGPARLGRLHYNDSKIQTPNFFLNLIKGTDINHDIYLAASDFKTKKKPIVYDCGSFFERRKFASQIFRRSKIEKILPDEHVGFNVPRSTAEAAVERTVEFAKKYPGQGAVIQGSKYIDLREKCARELEDRPLLLIANGAKLIKNPRLLVEIVTRVRELTSPNSTLYFPFAPPHFFYLLAYMGVDLFDSADCILKAREKKFATTRGFLSLQSLKELPCSCKICENKIPSELGFGDILMHNVNIAKQVVKEIREAIRGNGLRELAEEKASCCAASMAALRLLDREKQDFLERYTAVSL
ncbi:MAG: tRNA-guanine transglycosylase [Euryarchaeota archaeon]|nr:tRNA-guanine transglycosylase [Euryarchaeota archaeon]